MAHGTFCRVEDDVVESTQATGLLGHGEWDKAGETLRRSPPGEEVAWMGTTALGFLDRRSRKGWELGLLEGGGAPLVPAARCPTSALPPLCWGGACEATSSLCPFWGQICWAPASREALQGTAVALSCLVPVGLWYTVGDD